MKNEAYDLIIIGGGVAGLAAAIYCGRFNLKQIVIGKVVRGTLPKANYVENYPGFKKIRGLELANLILEHAKEYTSEIISDDVLSVSKTGNCFNIKTKKSEYAGKAILFATGSDWKKLNVKGENEFMHNGVHYCALCDGRFYKGKTIAVIGGGDSAVKEALLLSEYAKKVYIITRSELRPEPINLEKLKKNNKIEAITGMQVKEIIGDKHVNSVVLSKKYAGSDSLKVDGVFVNVGQIPLSELAKKLGVNVNEKGEIITDKESRTNIKGVYAAGDVTDSKFKQAITGVGEAVKAVYSAYEYISKEKISARCFDEE